MLLENKRILLGMGGSVAVYKSAELIRELKRNHAQVDVIPTKAALQFVTPLLLEALSQRKVHAEVMELERGHIPHIELAYAADLMLICPATADLLASMAQGLAHNALLSTLLSVRAPLLIAPAMESRMWEHAATVENVRILQERGALLIGPDSGDLASGRAGAGRLAPLADILAAVQSALSPKDFLGQKILVTAGPTVEDLDPVRFLSNRSSGKMGVALAVSAAQRGAEVVLVHGPLSVAIPQIKGLRSVAIRSAQELFEQVKIEMRPECKVDVAILAAAVADYTPVKVAAHKIKKDAQQSGFSLEQIALKRTVDILKYLGQARAATKQTQRSVLVGFAAETEDLKENARRKLEKKQVDLICANDVGDLQNAVFGSEENALLLVSKEKTRVLSRQSKELSANAILDEILILLQKRESIN